MLWNANLVTVEVAMYVPVYVSHWPAGFPWSEALLDTLVAISVPTLPVLSPCPLTVVRVAS